MEVRSGLQETPRSGLSHLSRANQERSATLQVAEDLLGQLARDRADAHRAFGDAGFVPNSLRGRKGLREATAEQGAHRARAFCGVEGLFDLAEDLGLAHDERVQARSDPEDVPDHVDAALLVEHVVGRTSREALGEGILRDLRGFDGVRAGCVELDSIAR